MKPTVRILIVTDDFETGASHGGFLHWKGQAMPEAVTSMTSREFHLGEYLSVLESTAWVGFNSEFTKAHRSLPGNELNEAQLKADRGADVVGFRFHEPFLVKGQNRTLGDYDMILFFSTTPGNPDVLNFAQEAEAIAKFMENGGGFFATGDHANTGAYLCGLIPRVRSMRRWYYDGDYSSESAPGPNGEAPAPPPLGTGRHDTTWHGTRSHRITTGPFEDQSDEIAQQIAPTFYNAGVTVRQGYIAHRYLPHPLLCSPDGVVSYLPDHMHEGQCEVPSDLTRSFKLGNATVREYPDYVPLNKPANFVPSPLAPEVVAIGSVFAGNVSPAIDIEHKNKDHEFDVAQEDNFGVIGAWDGHRVSRGRVVVDSTWHHFFNINLTGDRFLEDDNVLAQDQKLQGFYVADGKGGLAPNDDYQMIQWYFRNIIYWLIPASRMQQIWWHTLMDFTTRPQLIEELVVHNLNQYKKYTFDHYMYFGQLAEQYLTKARGACAIYTIQVIFYKPKIPWWEWIEEVVDVWNPIQKTRPGRINEVREQVLGLLGAGPRHDVIATLTLGAALVAAASTRSLKTSDLTFSDVTDEIQKMWPTIFNHAASEFGKQLALGAKVQSKLEKLVKEQTQSRNVVN